MEKNKNTSICAPDPTPSPALPRITCPHTAFPQWKWASENKIRTNRTKTQPKKNDWNTKFLFLSAFSRPLRVSLPPPYSHQTQSDTAQSLFCMWVRFVGAADSVVTNWGVSAPNEKGSKGKSHRWIALLTVDILIHIIRQIHTSPRWWRDGYILHACTPAIYHTPLLHIFNICRTVVYLLYRQRSVSALSRLCIYTIVSRRRFPCVAYLLRQSVDDCINPSMVRVRAAYQMPFVCCSILRSTTIFAIISNNSRLCRFIYICDTEVCNGVTCATCAYCVPTIIIIIIIAMIIIMYTHVVRASGIRMNGPNIICAICICHDPRAGSVKCNMLCRCNDRRRSYRLTLSIILTLSCLRRLGRTADKTPLGCVAVSLRAYCVQLLLKSFSRQTKKIE